MEKDRKTKIITIVALFIGVATLTLGFAVYNTKLKIQARATVTPDNNALKVVLSKEQNSVVVGTIMPTGDGKDATISNSVAPTISNLNAEFVNPGEKVVYEFYAMNVGKLDAYLNKIEYVNVTNKEANKVCTAGEGTTDASIQSACESIRITVKIGEEDRACQTSIYGAHMLSKDLSEKVVVTIEYEQSGEVADGPFSVEFGDIILNYSLNDTETKNIATCDDYVASPVYHFDINGRTNIVDNDSDGTISLSDKVILGTESFYVININGTTGEVALLSEWNLNVGENTVEGTAGMQNSACKGYVSDSDKHCTLSFSSTNYWDGTVRRYPSFVYNEQSNLYTYVENYVNKLKEAGYSSVTGRLIKQEELVSLNCSTRNSNCTSAPAWVKNTSFWSGTASESTIVWRVNTNGDFNSNAYTDSSSFGVRPVIVIPSSKI